MFTRGYIKLRLPALNGDNHLDTASLSDTLLAFCFNLIPFPVDQVFIPFAQRRL